MSRRSPRRSTWSLELCAVCALQGQKVCLVVSDEPVHPTVYCTHGRFDGLLYCKRCPTCRAKHNLSYAEESTRLAQGKQVPYDGAMDLGRTPLCTSHLLVAPPLYSTPVCNVLVPVYTILVRGIG